jgi:hypothetical protein
MAQYNASHSIDPKPIRPQEKISSVLLSFSCSLSCSLMMRSLRPLSFARRRPSIFSPDRFRRCRLEPPLFINGLL